MRISDWSSDVCSSDLLAAQAKLVFDRRLPLIVGGITRIESDTGHGVYLSPGRPCLWSQGLTISFTAALKSDSLRVTSFNAWKFEVAAMKASITQIGRTVVSRLATNMHQDRKRTRLN